MTRRPALTVLLLLWAGTARAADDVWRTDWDATLYTSAQAIRLTPNSVLDPGNRLARLASSALETEARVNLKLESEAVRLSARPILTARAQDDGTDAGTPVRGYLSQWQLRARLGETLAVALGRELMNWGPAQFRSPSSPFYFDNGRSDPSRELSGVDAVKLAWTPDTRSAYSLAYVRDSGHAAGTTDPWRDTWLARGEVRGDDWSGSLALARAAGRPAFLGLYGQWTVSDAWLLYGEAASSTRAGALVSPADPDQPFTLLAESGRRGAVALGATHTLENGHSLTLEYLYDGHGYTDAEAAALFARAAADPAAAGLALAHLPPLLGRHYVHLVWQSNLLAEGDYWRLMWSRNLGDAGNEWTAWLEHPCTGHTSLYALALARSGGPRREFAALAERSLSVGLRLALP